MRDLMADFIGATSSITFVCACVYLAHKLRPPFNFRRVQRTRHHWNYDTRGRRLW